MTHHRKPSTRIRTHDGQFRTSPFSFRKRCLLLSAFIVLAIIAIAARVFWIQGAQKNLNTIALGVGAFAGLFAVFMCIIPQSLVRIDADGIMFASARWRLRRTLMRWSDIERVKWLHSYAMLARGGQKMTIIYNQFPRQQKNALRSTLQRNLAPRFDLHSEAFKYKQAQRINAFMGMVLLASIYAAINVLHPLQTPTLWKILPVAFLTIGGIAFIQWRRARNQKLLWRFPDDSTKSYPETQDLPR